MATNLYHLLSFLPATEGWEMPPVLEQLAQQLVASGRVRISADHERNFVRYGTANSDLTFTTRELTDPRLATTTQARIARLVAPAAGAQGIADIRAHLLADLKKARGISAEKEIRVARVLVQSAHPVVIQLLLQSGTDIFVSYAHNVADLMAVHAWETHGINSGLQSTESDGTAVYISAGGDPFFEGDHKTYTTDGFPALARMVVIAGQELGHFADLRRSTRGIIGRHSTDANHSQLRADPAARAHWLGDQRSTAQLAAAYAACGLGTLRRTETSVDFYHRRLRYSPPWMVWQALRFIAWGWFIARCRTRHLPTRFGTRPYQRLGSAITQFLADMAFNLAPDAEVYRNPDPLVEEAIIVLEAVARVPQQVHKWGHAAVKTAWPGLYSFYFGQIIPACAAALSTPLAPQTTTKLQQLRIAIRRALRPKPDYYP